MNNRLKISIGIPAYNEEANIQSLLRSLLSQKQENIELLEIIVVSDASTDATNAEVKKVNDPRIVLTEGEERTGKAMRQDDILKVYKGDILVILDADVLPANELLLESLADPLIKDESTGIVGGKITPLGARNHFEKIIIFSERFKTSLSEKINKGDNIYLCPGRVRAFSRKFLKGFEWPASVGEDAFSYLSCISRGFKFIYEPLAEVSFRAAKNFPDYGKQANRFEACKTYLVKYFNPKLVEESYRIPKSTFLRTSIEFFFQEPVLFVSYVIIYLATRAIPAKRDSTKPLWESAVSTKRLN